jgi:hypothetical protein
MTDFFDKAQETTSAFPITSDVSLQNMLETENRLKGRVMRSMRPKEPVAFEFTKDKGYLQQYYVLRELEFWRTHKTQPLTAQEDAYDSKSNILVARIGNKCVGGVRLTHSSPRTNSLLPLETEDFRLAKVFPEIEHKQLKYGQFSGMVLSTEFRGGDVTRQMFLHLYRKVCALGIKIVFAATPISNAKAYKLNCSALGISNTHIVEGVDLPVNSKEGVLKHYLIRGDIPDADIFANQDSRVVEVL